MKRRAATDKTVSKQESTSDKDKQERIAIGDYVINIEQKNESCVAEIVSDSGAIAATIEATFVELPEILGFGRLMTAMENVKMQAIAKYHEVVDSQDGLIDISVLAEHPYNQSIYGKEENVDKLIEVLERPSAEIFEVVYSRKFGLISGNRRIKAAIAVNAKLAAKNQSPRFESVLTKFVDFDSLEAELTYMVLQNIGREKTVVQKKQEAKILLAMATALPKSASVIAKKGNAALMEQAQELAGLSRSAAFLARQCNEQIKHYQNPALKEKLQDLAVESPHRCKQVIGAQVPKSLRSTIDLEDYQKQVLDSAIAEPSCSVAYAIARTNSRLHTTAMAAPQENAAADSETVETEELANSRLLEKMIEYGDNPNDNRKTPEELIAIAKAAMGQIDLDAFAMATDPSRVCDRGYTIFDNAFGMPPEKFGGNVFANPPFSYASEAINLLFSAIAKGITTQLFLVLPSSVLSSKAFHSAVKDFNPCVFIPNKRIEFEAGELLLAQGGTAKSSNREPTIVLFWRNDSSYKAFECFVGQSGWLGQKPTNFNPYDFVNLIGKSEWVSKEGDSDVYTTKFLGIDIAVGLENNNNYWIKVGEKILPVSLPLVYAQSLAIAEAINSLSF